MKSVRMQEEAKEEGCTILVVDEDEDMRAVFVEALQEKGCKVLESQDGIGALSTLEAVVPHLIVTDLKIPNGGYPYLRQLKAAAPKSSILVMTAHGDSQSKVKAHECGAHGYFEKPLHLKDLKNWISQMCLVNPCGNM